MSQHEPSRPAHSASISSYAVGFGLALLLTFTAFALVQLKLLSGLALIGALLGLATIQTSVQLWFFLHLGREEKPQWNTVFLFNTISVILLIVIASIWVMNSLNHRMMSPAEMEKYAIEEGTKGF